MNPLVIEFRVLFWAILSVIVPFGLLLFLVPNETELYWAWIVPHARSSVLIGAGYVGAIAYYLLALKENDWLQVKNGMGGLVIFCLMLLFATVAHWELFRPYHITTLVWLMFYYVGPILVPVLAQLQGSRVETATTQGTTLATGWRMWLVVRGVSYLGLALVASVLAGTASDLWPWSIRPLELRVFNGAGRYHRMECCGRNTGWSAVAALPLGACAYWRHWFRTNRRTTYQFNAV